MIYRFTTENMNFNFLSQYNTFVFKSIGYISLPLLVCTAISLIDRKVLCCLKQHHFCTSQNSWQNPCLDHSFRKECRDTKREVILRQQGTFRICANHKALSRIPHCSTLLLLLDIRCSTLLLLLAIPYSTLPSLLEGENSVHRK